MAEADKELRLYLAALSEGYPTGEGKIESAIIAGREKPISKLPLCLMNIGQEKLADAFRISGLGTTFVEWNPLAHEHIKYLADRFPERLVVSLRLEGNRRNWKLFSELKNMQSFYMAGAADDDLTQNDSFKRLRSQHRCLE